MFLAGSRVTSKTTSREVDGAKLPSSMTFYKRAKALYDSDYEEDRIIILQALILLGWYGEETGDVTKNVFYWNGLATTVAQGSGVHRSAENARLPRSDKRLWKRIWWALFTRDRSMAVALGRPVHINTDDCDVEMICVEDFLDDEEGYLAEYRPDPLHVQFFIQYVSLCKIMSLILQYEHSAISKNNEQSSKILRQCDRTLVDWVQNCPKEIKWEQSRYNFWAALLHCAYYVTIGLRHRAYLPELPSEEDSQKRGYLQGKTYPLPFIVFQAACEVTSAAESMIQANQIQLSPAFMIYALVSALNIHIYQMQSETSSVDTTSRMRIQTCMNALQKLSNAWVAANIVHARFETILSDKGFRRDSHGALELAKRRHGAENTANGSNLIQSTSAMVDCRSNQAMPSQFRDGFRQAIPDPSTDLFAQNDFTSSITTSSSFQTINPLVLAGPAVFNVNKPSQNDSYPASIPLDTLLDPLLNPQMAHIESHIVAKGYDYRYLFPQDADSGQDVSNAF